MEVSHLPEEYLSHFMDYTVFISIISSPISALRCCR